MLTRFDGQAIERCFKTRERSVRGMYEVALYDGKTHKWVDVVIDDYVPTERNKPLFAHPNQNVGHQSSVRMGECREK